MTKNQETHWTCANRLKAEGGNAKCCDCDKHDGCGNPNNTIEEIIEKFGKMAFHTQQEAKEWLRQALEQVERETREKDIEVVNSPTVHAILSGTFMNGYMQGEMKRQINDSVIEKAKEELAQALRKL